MNYLKKLWLAVICVCAVPVVAAKSNQWDIDLKRSQLNVVSVKKDSIAEVHQFKQFYGILNLDGGFIVDIALDSIETNIDIRNQRMSDHLFETKRFPVAVLTGKVDIQKISQLKIGQNLKLNVPAQVRLHGNKADVTMQITVIKLTNNQLHVSSRQPVIINANDFELSEGVEKLKELANLSSIDLAIPVTFDTVWTKN
jgi:hypothetical protein